MVMQKRTLAVSSGAAMRKVKTEGIPVRMPSGFVIALRNVSKSALLMEGLFSDPLSALVYELLNADTRKLEKMDPRKIIEGTSALQEAICKLAYVTPRIVDAPNADDEIGIEDVSDADREFVMDLIYKPVQELAKTFRDEEDEPMEPLDKGEALQTASVGDSGSD